jgi:DNA-binding transcriptional ArsR family regulator
MKKTAKPSAMPTPMTQKALYLSHFTPSMMQPDTLQQMLVQRQPLIDACYDDVVHSVATRSKHHYLFVGPRGIGKTHLISLLHHRLSLSKEVREKGLIAWMREEEWGVTSFFELVLRILRTLDQKQPELGIAARTTPLYELTLKQAEVQASSLLLDVLGDKTLIVLLENLDDLFDQLGDAGQRQFRAFIQNHPQLVLVTTTPSLFAGVSLQKSPFYGFFDIQALKEFSLEDVVDLLKKIAVERGDEALAEFIGTPEGHARIRAVHHLAEGNPRIYVIFAQFLSREALDELVQAVMHTLDELTPYYQARMKELSGQQRKIVEYLVSYRGAAPVKQIAKACFITHQTCSGQLKQLREKRYVRSIEQGRESYYELTEPLMRLCMEVKSQRGEPIGLFVEILRIWYTEAELSEWLESAHAKGSIEERYVRRALELTKKETGVDLILIAQLKELAASLQDRDLKKSRRVFDEICARVPTNKGSQEMRAQALLGVSWIFPLSNESVKENIDTLASALQRSFKPGRTELTRTNAYNTYMMQLVAAISLIELEEHEAEATASALIESLSAFPSYAAAALIHSGIQAFHSAARLKAFEVVSNALLKIASERDQKKIGKVFVRLFQAIGNWKRTNDERELLVLSREERNFVMSLPPFEAQITYTPRVTK